MFGEREGEGEGETETERETDRDRDRETERQRESFRYPHPRPSNFKNRACAYASYFGHMSLKERRNRDGKLFLCRPEK